MADVLASAPTAAPTAAESTPCVFIKKKKRPRKGQRKRPATETHSDAEEDDGVVVSARRGPRGGLSSSTKSTVKSAEEAVSSVYRSTKEAKFSGPQDGGATRIIDVDTERDRDAQAIFERKLEINAQLQDEEGSAQGKKLYRGQAGYQTFSKPKDTTAGDAFKSFAGRGPMRAPLHIRSSVRWDYQPDICKDYKETGYCGFGDTCKFLHDRSDYKAGWQIDQEIDSGEYNSVDMRQYEVKGSDDDSDGSDDELPFACFICRGPFVNPVVTKCKHYFCEKCALSHYRKSKKCFVCNEPTGGVFMPAKDLIKKIKEREAAASQLPQADSDNEATGGEEEVEGEDGDE